MLEGFSRSSPAHTGTYLNLTFSSVLLLIFNISKEKKNKLKRLLSHDCSGIRGSVYLIQKSIKELFSFLPGFSVLLFIRGLVTLQGGTKI